MAELLLTPDNPGPANDGEARVVERLVNDLPENFVVIPNLEVPVQGGQLVEIDALVLGPDVAWVVEVKDHTPDVEINQHSYLVGGMPRGHAVKTTRRKCQQLHSRMAGINHQLGRVWFQPLIVLAQPPAALSVANAMEPFVRLLDDAVHLISHPAQIGLYRDPISSTALVELRKRLADDAKPRPARFDSDMYAGTQLIAHVGGWELWLGEHKVFKEAVELHVRHVPPGASAAERDLLKQRALHPAVLGHRVEKHPNIAAPKDPFFLEDGSAVLVVPARTLPTIGDLVAEGIGNLDDDTRRRFLLGVARAIDFCHRRGVALRGLGPDSILVTEHGAPIVTGFLYAHAGPTDTAADTPTTWDTVVPSDWQAFEHKEGSDVSFAADRWFVGRLAHELFPTGWPADLSGPIHDLLQGDQSDRASSLVPLIDGLTPPAPAATPETIEPAEGAVFGDRYELRSKIGAGGMAEVWDAYDLIQQVPVAIKILNPDTAGEAFRAECANLQAITHPGVVKIRDATLLNGRWLIIMERLHGHPVDTLILGGPISEPETVQIGLGLLSTLNTFHPDVSELWSSWSDDRYHSNEIAVARRQPNRLVHRDITPRNVIIVDGRGPVLIDFGFAAGGAAAVPGGTAAYQPPDAIPGSVDPDLDLYAVGLIMCELLGGGHKQSNTDRGVSPVPSRVSSELAGVLEQATHPKRIKRFQDATAFIDALIGLGFPEVELPAAPVDVVELQANIWRAVRAHEFDEARSLCPSAWFSVRNRIDELEALLSQVSDDDSILEVRGYRLVYRRQRSSPEEVDTDNERVSPAQVWDYVVEGPGGDTLEIHAFAGTVDGEPGYERRWVNSGHGFEATGPLALLAGGALRMSRLRRDDPGMLVELAMAVHRPTGKRRSAILATLSDMNAASGVNVADVLVEHGALAIGTRSELFGDTSRRKNYLCARFADDATHALAVAYFLTRVLPLA